MGTKHTPGEWHVNSQQNLIICGKKWIADLSCKGFEPVSEEERKCNAELIAEAGNVVNETGKTPRQLADLNKELIQALEIMIDGSIAPKWKITMASKLIKKAKE